jgi:hypothetical protein
MIWEDYEQIRCFSLPDHGKPTGEELGCCSSSTSGTGT